MITSNDLNGVLAINIDNQNFSWGVKSKEDEDKDKEEES